MHVARPHRQPLTAQASSLAGRTQTVVVARKAPSLRALGLGQSHATATATTTAGAGPTATSAGATDTAVDSAAHQKHNRPHDGCRTRDQWYCRLDHTTVNSAHPSVDGAGPTPAGCRGPHTTKAGHWIQRCDGIPCTRANGVYQHTAKSRTARCRRTRPAAGIYCRANTLGRIDGHAKYDVASGRTDHRGASANIADTSAKSTSDGCNWDDLAACKGCAHRCTTNCAGTGACVDGCGVGKTATRIGIAPVDRTADANAIGNNRADSNVPHAGIHRLGAVGCLWFVSCRRQHAFGARGGTRPDADGHFDSL